MYLGPPSTRLGLGQAYKLQRFSYYITSNLDSEKLAKCFEWLRLELTDNSTPHSERKTSALTTLALEVPMAKAPDLDLTVIASLSEALSDKRQLPILNKVEIRILSKDDGRSPEGIILEQKSQIEFAFRSLQDEGMLKFCWN